MKNNILTEKILIVDSSIDYAKFIQNFLKESGYLCYIALSYDEAITMSYDKIPDCILVDYMLPNAGACRLSQHIKNDNMLKANMVVTNEPGIYIPGALGVRIEDTVLITKSGCINLTKSDKNYIIIDKNKN